MLQLENHFYELVHKLSELFAIVLGLNLISESDYTFVILKFHDRVSKRASPIWVGSRATDLRLRIVANFVAESKRWPKQMESVALCPRIRRF